MQSEHWDARYASRELVWSAEPNRWVVEELGGLPPGRALDLAAGEGRNAIWLAARGFDVTGVDFSRAGLDKARRLQAAQPDAERLRLTWVVADLRDYRPEPGAFDLVLVSYLQVPEDLRRQVMREAARALAPTGVLLVVAHDTANLAEGVGGPGDPAVLYTADDVLADLRDLPGLAVERAERVRRAVETPDGLRHALDALVRIRRRASA